MILKCGRVSGEQLSATLHFLLACGAEGMKYDKLSHLGSEVRQKVALAGGYNANVRYMGGYLAKIRLIRPITHAVRLDV